MFNPKEHRRQCKIARQQHVRQTIGRLCESDDLFLDNSITITENNPTDSAKNNATNVKPKAIDSSHITWDEPSIGLAQHGKNTTYSMSFTFNWTIKKFNKTTRHVNLSFHNSMRLFNNLTVPIMITYDSGANGNYNSKRDCVKADLPILRQSTRKVWLANRGTIQEKHVT